MAMDRVEILRAACCIAGLDQQITQREREMIQRLAEHAGVGETSMNAMLDRARRDQNFYKEQFRILKTEAEPTMRALLCVAAADRRLTADERIILGHFAGVLGMSEERFLKLLGAAEKQLAK